MWLAFKDIIFDGLQYLFSITGDYGWAIVLLTVVIRIVLAPLIVKQTRSMHELQGIQPKIKELQKKYKNDKEKLQEETLKFYQENKINPFGGCMPILLQMPVFLALFQVLGGTPENPGHLLRHLQALEPAESVVAKRFSVLIEDITVTPAAVFASDGLVATLPYIALVVLFGLSVWLPIQLAPGEKQQKQIGMFMAVMMLYFGWISPAGVLLYWVTSAIIGIAQQQITLKVLTRSKEKNL
ncbi:MAG: YidC/Oxa1 family membrane protein insertase [Actinobacteria bacterium]|nr:YidC/Oxa1 family membrane protein insertase [Actinomycetota bacterium]